MLAVARLGRLSAAAEVLQVNHTTVARRLAALEKSLGERVLVRTSNGWELTDRGREVMQVAEQVERAMASVTTSADQGLSGVVRIAGPDGFATHVVAPAAVDLGRRHPHLRVEVISATQRLRQHRSGVDIEVVVGEPDVHRATAVELMHYALGLYASTDYLDQHPAPRTLADIADHPLCYYIESSLQVDGLDLATDVLPAPSRWIRSTSVFVHLETTLLGAGIGILPDYMARRHPSLVRLLPDDYRHELTYWAVVRSEAARSPVVRATLDVVRRAAR